MDARAYVESRAREFIALDSDQIHAPNERTALSLLRGAEVSAYLWEELASAGSDLT